MRLVVLDAQTLVWIADDELTDREVDTYQRAFKKALPDYRLIVFRGPGEVVDLRNDVEATDLANQLLSRLTAVIP